MWLIYANVVICFTLYAVLFFNFFENKFNQLGEQCCAAIMS